MFIPSSMPSSLADMLAFLQPMVDDGFFDSVAYDNESSPTKIICTQDGNDILEISKSSTAFSFRPFVAEGQVGSPAGRTPTIAVNYCARCTGGAVFTAVNLPSTPAASGIFFIIGKTSAGKTAFIAWAAPGMSTNSATNMFQTCFGDDPAIPRYSLGFYVVQNGSSSAPNDRTALQKIPVFGAMGSTDYFTTVFFRNMYQYFETGEHIIDGKSYGCFGLIAITDEEE